jgi:diaminopimelate epimerase
MPTFTFWKMHGLGNDFVVLDARNEPVYVTPELAARLCDRHTGIGCDQLLVLHPPRTWRADVFLKIHDRTGKQLAVCANGTRCVASLILDARGVDRCVVETDRGLITAWAAGHGLISIDMNEIVFDWQAVALSKNVDTLFTPLGLEELPDPACANIGNSHATFFVDDPDAIDLRRLGPMIENHPLFAQSTNIGIASLAGPDRIRLSVWETGTGVTLACGSGACAAAVAAARRHLTGRRVEVMMQRGSLTVEWAANNHVLLTGPAETSFVGTFESRVSGIPLSESKSLASIA